MRVVVTGATGNVGTAVCEALVADPAVEEVVGVARRVPAAGVEGVRYVESDVAEDDLTGTMAGAGAVVHLAWLFQPTHDPLRTWRVNVHGSERVFDAAAAAGVGALVHASSVGAYRPAPGRFVDESWPTDGLPTAAYGREKSYVERLLDAVELRNPGLRVVRLRPCFIFQRRAATEQRRLFLGPLVPRVVARRGALPVVPLPAELRFQAMHAADVAEAYRVAVVSDVRGAFNVAADPTIDVPTLGEVLGSRAVAVPGGVVRAAAAAAWHLHLAPADPTLVDLALGIPLLDTTRARTVLGWTPTRSGTEALREMLDGFADGAGGGSAPLAPDTVHGRVEELATGVGERDRA
jgi:nucleoside-diphosphate-sugar epimerase